MLNFYMLLTENNAPYKAAYFLSPVHRISRCYIACYFLYVAPGSERGLKGRLFSVRHQSGEACLVPQKTSGCTLASKKPINA